MKVFSNELNLAQVERLAILAEECGEVIQVVGKILRHGYHSYNPTLPPMQQKPNTALLQKELGDLLWAISKLDDAADVDFQIPRTNASLNMWLRRKENTAAPYLHHQERTPAPEPAGEAQQSWYAPNRCQVCGWLLQDDLSKGCIRGSCSYRPGEHTMDYPLIRARYDWLEKQPEWPFKPAQEPAEEAQEDNVKCEGCDSPATTSDSEGVPLCAECLRITIEEQNPREPAGAPQAYQYAPVGEGIKGIAPAPTAPSEDQPVKPARSVVEETLDIFNSFFTEPCIHTREGDIQRMTAVLRHYSKRLRETALRKWHTGPLSVNEALAEAEREHLGDE